MTETRSSGQLLHSGTLHTQRGLPVRIPYQIRLLNADDLPALESFRSYIFDQLPDLDVYFPETPEFAGLHLGDRGVTFGLLAQGKLAACSVLGLPRPGVPAFVEDLSQPRPAATATAHMASCMVHPDIRGNGLQELFVTLRTIYALGAGRPHLLARVALSNPVSLANLIESGFFIRRVLVMHSGRLRYLLHRNMLQTDQAWIPGSSRVLRRWDVDGQRAAIEEGLLGCAVDCSGEEPLVTYARPVEPAAAIPVEPAHHLEALT